MSAIELRTLGTVDLVRVDGTATESVSLQPKPLALLVYLAVARPRGLQRRDTLLALFWPELDESRARNALSQTLHRVRAALVDGCIVGRGQEEIGVDYARLRCDAIAFEETLEAGQPAEALELYRGDFLNGFHVSGAPGFERWLDGERARLRRLAKRAAEALAERAEDEGHTVGAVEWLRCTIAIDPLDEEALRRLIQILADTGERATAVRDYETFRRRLDEDYDLEPAPETRALVEEIREHREAPRPGNVAGAGGTGSTAVEAADSEPTLSEPAPASFGPERDPGDLERAASLGERRKRSLPRRFMAGLGLSVGIAAALALGWMAWNGGGREPASDLKSVAVLPLADLSADPDDRYFVDGMHEAIIEHLAKLGDLRVVSSTSVQRYRGTSQGIPEIADELGVSNVVEGALQRAGGRVRITAQLIEAESDDHLWAESWERELTAENVFAIQTDIARRIADGLEVSLSPEEEARIARQPTEDLEAYGYYLRANEYFRNSAPGSTRLAIDLYEKAIEVDPDFALAHARLAIPLSGPSGNSERAREAIDAALQLEPGLPEAHLALGYYWYWGHSNYEKALEHLVIAREGGLNSSYLHHLTGGIQRRQGRLHQAVRSFKRALERAPRDAHMAWDVGVTYRMLRRYAEAEAYLDRARSLAPYAPMYHRARAMLDLAWRGDREAAWTAIRNGREAIDEVFLSGPVVTSTQIRLLRVLAADHPRLLEARDLADGIADTVGYYLAKAVVLDGRRDRDRAEAYYDSARVVLEGEYPGEPTGRSSRARAYSRLGIVYAGLGRVEDAIRHGERAVELLPVSEDAFYGPDRVATLADIYVTTGEFEAAIDRLEYLLSIPSGMSINLLRVDPHYDPLRDHPRFQALVESDE
ncbi:MAG: BTAD domain-containing putative transcriptional regulator [Gemmatimonadota bacterium]